jgi:hypothetical protein
MADEFLALLATQRVQPRLLVAPAHAMLLATRQAPWRRARADQRAAAGRW